MIPADDIYVIGYTFNLFQKHESFKNMGISYFAIKYFQKITDYENFLAEGLPYLVLERLKRTSQKIMREKLPLTTELLHKLCKIFGGKKDEPKRFNGNFVMYLFFYGIFKVL